jgi:hypothetical protein
MNQLNPVAESTVECCPMGWSRADGAEVGQLTPGGTVRRWAQGLAALDDGGAVRTPVLE